MPEIALLFFFVSAKPGKRASSHFQISMGQGFLVRKKKDVMRLFEELKGISSIWKEDNG